MGKIVSINKNLFKLWRRIRYGYYLKLLDRSAKTLLDVGCSDGKFIKLAKKEGYYTTGIDIKENIEDTKKTADIVTCFQVLEHIHNPVKAVKNLNRLYKKQLIISIPNEPFFSLYRFGWEKEHLWAITPRILKHYLGKPSFEKRIIFNRYYVAVWSRNRK